MRRLLQSLRFGAGLGAALILSACASAPAPEPQIQANPQLEFGIDMARRGLWSEALFRFQKAAESKPGDPRVLNNMAVAHEALGQFEQALEFYQDALKAEPNNRELRRNYSRFVEFYRAFKPDQQKDGTLPAAEPSNEAPQ